MYSSDMWLHSHAISYTGHESASKRVLPATCPAPLKCLRLNIWVRVLWIRTKIVLKYDSGFCLANIMLTDILAQKPW